MHATDSITLTIREGSDCITVFGVDPQDVNRYVQQLLEMQPKPAIELQLIDEPPFEDQLLLRDGFDMGMAQEFPLPVTITYEDAPDVAAELQRIAAYVDIFQDSAESFSEGLADA